MFIVISEILSIFANSSHILNAASSNGNDGIQINAEYLISDIDGMHSEYVVIAKNTSGKDLSVKACFEALSADNDPVKVVSDEALAVKNGQSFILYGQFKNDDIEDAASYSYKLTSDITDDCKYDCVNIDTTSDEDGVLTVSGINYSSENISLVNVRCVFFKDGAPVFFDHVNLGDGAYTFRSGSSNTQELGMLHPDYDNYVLTYQVSGDM